uniref:Uncharacterized protein n=1 Tax=Nelumbo nucifera TaxID=4432 RepID=A0A822ZSF9_NELNU|nr:TPA_asm: hypothetical protein HUJ06_004509 [Nelumbo nucifera]
MWAPHRSDTPVPQVHSLHPSPKFIDSTKFHPLLLHRSNRSPRGSSPSPLSSIIHSFCGPSGENPFGCCLVRNVKVKI